MQRRWSGSTAGALAALAVAAGLAACSSEAPEARSCAERSGATFCVRLQGTAGIEPTAEGLLPGSTLTYVVGGDAPDMEPFTSPVGPNGTPDRAGTIGFLSITGAADLRGATVVFTGTAADGTPVEATVAAPG